MIKIGDRVRVTDMLYEEKTNTYDLEIGETGTVACVLDASTVSVSMDDGTKNKKIYPISKMALEVIEIRKLSVDSDRSAPSISLYELFEIYGDPENRNRVFHHYDNVNKAASTINFVGGRILVDGADLSDRFDSVEMRTGVVTESDIVFLKREELIDRGIVLID